MCQELCVSLEDVPVFPHTGRTKGSSPRSSMGREEVTAKVQPCKAAEV